MIGVVPFLFPMILTASAAAAAPVIIHLMMRTKPRRVIFPAMRFVLKTHRANLSKLKVKHLILLAMRMAMIVLAAFLLARSQIPQWSASPEQALPTAAVIIIDTSASMGYRHHGKTLLQRAKRLATQVVESLPPGSLVLVLNTERAGRSGRFLGARDVVTRQIVDTPQGFGRASVARALAAGVDRLGRIDLPRKAVYVLSDMTAQAWRDEVKPAAAADVRFVLVDCWGGEDVNFALGQLELGAMAAPLGAEVTLDTTVLGHRAAGQLNVQVELDGRKVAEQPVTVAASSAAPVSFSVVPRRQGVVHGRVVLAGEDPLAMDNARYFTIEVNRPADLLILRDPTTIGRGDWTTFLMGSAIAPAGQGASGGGWVRRRTISADRLGGSHLDAADVVLVSNVSALAAAQWTLLETYVRGGGRLWIVVGPLVSAQAYNTPEARRLVPVVLGAQEALDTPVSWRVRQAAHPMLAPFAGADNPPLSEVRCTGRFGVEALAAEASVVLSYDDGVPAIVTQRLGAGEVLLWNFSPARGFSNLAGLEQFPILARRAARLLAGQARAETMHTCGSSVVVPFPRRLAGAAVTVRKPGAEGDVPAAADAAGRTVTVPADTPGPWDLRFTCGDLHESRGFSANTSPLESDMTAADPAKLEAMFPPDRMVVAGDIDAIRRAWQRGQMPLDLTVPLLLALVVLMTGESYFANRFYRRSETAVLPPE